MTDTYSGGTLPPGVTYESTPTGFNLSYPWYNGSGPKRVAAGIIAMGLWLGPTALFATEMLDLLINPANNNDRLAIILFSPALVIVSATMYALFALKALTRTHVALDLQTLTASAGPLPWFGRRLATSRPDVEAMVVVEAQFSKYDTYFALHGLRCEESDQPQMTVLMKWIPDMETADFICQEIHAMWTISDTKGLVAAHSMNLLSRGIWKQRIWPASDIPLDPFDM